ncbi:MAG: CDP-diacylglycerol--glycerol-3-phosphate 3-phosphatidyltransferase [Thioalkalispiraceae bacterium]|jgi:CDP-diacylglycerol--glycerol-3-phosphate 3-phosphatidyltransferase
MKGIPLTIPNLITLFRIIIIPVFVLAFIMPDYHYKPIILVSLFFLAGISDWVDGFLARMLKQQSAFGAFLDPVADKLMVTTAMVLLVVEHPELLMMFPAIVIIGREIAISALREWMANLGAQTKVKVSFIGKLKTASQLLAIGFLLYNQPIGSFNPTLVGYILLYIATILTLWSMIVYLRASWSSLVES